MILAIDCGSTNLKAALFDGSLQRLAEASVPVRYTVRDAERAEFDPEEFWRGIVQLIETLRPPAPVATVALTSQAQTFTVVDAAGRPRLPFLSWMDKRAVAEAAELEARLGADLHRHCSFAPHVPQLCSCKLLWVRRHLPEALTPEAFVVSLPEFAALRLAGVRAVDRNLAAMSGLYSLARGDWWDAALEAVGVRREQLGKLVDVGGVVAARSRLPNLPLASELNILLAGNDQTSGAFGTIGRCGGLLITLGTALVVYRYAGEKPGPFSAGGCWGPYPGGGYYELATRDEGCNALDWAVEQLTPGQHPREFDRLAAAAQPGEALFFPSRIRTPGAWTGSDSPAARARAVLEGICFSTRQLVVEELRAGLQGKPVLVIGGGSKSGFWLQMLAEVLNCPLRRGAGDNLLGAARMRQTKEIPAGEPGTGPLFRPSAERARQYASLYERWRQQATRGEER